MFPGISAAGVFPEEPPVCAPAQRAKHQNDDAQQDDNFPGTRFLLSFSACPSGKCRSFLCPWSPSFPPDINENATRYGARNAIIKIRPSRILGGLGPKISVPTPAQLSRLPLLPIQNPRSFPWRAAEGGKIKIFPAIHRAISAALQKRLCRLPRIKNGGRHIRPSSLRCGQWASTCSTSCGSSLAMTPDFVPRPMLTSNQRCLRPIFLLFNVFPGHWTALSNPGYAKARIFRQQQEPSFDCTWPIMCQRKSGKIKLVCVSAWLPWT